MSQQPLATDVVPAPEINLRQIVGLQAHLQFMEGGSSSRLVTVSCTTIKADRNELTLEIAGSAPLPVLDGAVVLDITLETALLQCYTTVRAVHGRLVKLRTPARPHIVQRRRFQRVPLFLSVTLRPEAAGEIPSQLINLSLDGAACVMVEPLPPGTSLVINLAATGLHPPTVTASVMRCTPTPNQLWVMGLQFLSLTPDQRLYLGKYLSSCQSDPTE
ncbi:MAG TPA: PilZ domain-containing protein [Symbiobacteriaceae bacterium]|nr:PilZ domain-containing protein [Symbiobacteriaceae bacterium]